MSSNRDNFTAKTKDTLAKRVGYLCSNPNCRKLTVGANEIEDKSTSVGVAAHITAASEGGPRYDGSLTKKQRIHINNGIWLCSNCATLIDKDPENYSASLLRQWKSSAERESIERLEGNYNKDRQIEIILSNGKKIDDYFPSPSMRMKINKPFVVVDLEKKFDLHVNLNGSGLSAQADAVALGISRALIKYDPELRDKLKKAGLLTRDARKVERKKYGLKKARRAEQITKR